MTRVCPKCAKEMKMPTGDKESDILIVFDKLFEQQSDYKVISALAAFKNNLSKYAGIDPAETRMAYLWMHKPNKDKDCLAISSDVVRENMEGKKLIILCGAEAVRFFTGYSINDVNGLVIELEGAPPMFACVSPNSMFVKGIGEFRFAMKKLKEYING